MPWKLIALASRTNSSVLTLGKVRFVGPQIYIAAQNQVYGPYDFAHVQAGVRSGQVTPQHVLSYDGRQWFPAATIWQQLLGQAAFPTQQAAAPMHAAPVAAASAPQGRVVAQGAQPMQAQPVHAQRVPQAAYAATPVHNVPPGVAMTAETVDPEAKVFTAWPGRVVIGLIGIVLSYMAGALAIGVIVRLPGGIELIRSSGIPELMEAAGGPLLFVEGAAVIAVSIWAYFAARDLALRNITPAPPAPGWACGWFYIPLANLVMPALVLQKLWKSSDWTTRGTRRPSGTLLIPLWWYGIAVCNVWLLASAGCRTYLLRHNVPGLARVVMKKGARPLEQFMYDVMQSYFQAVPVLFFVELAAWGIGLALFVMFAARLRTRVEMG
ncbi:MAG: hypothetical protein C0483_17775 [Pirellula sp.]|nr:hypothetical protein [Pirellula sp.]